MISAEQMIYNQQKLIEKLEKENKELEGEVREVLGIAETWKKSYKDLDDKYKRDIGNRDQTIDQLQKELDEVKRIAYP